VRIFVCKDTFILLMTWLASAQYGGIQTRCCHVQHPGLTAADAMLQYVLESVGSDAWCRNTTERCVPRPEQEVLLSLRRLILLQHKAAYLNST
jgi:hypothetical protein